jgi:tRNA(Ile)-lysidine synthase
LLILRPLLGLYRGDVESYLALRGLPWRRDSTNTDERFFRNRIRAGLVPFLDSRFSGWKRALETLGDTQRLAAGFISAEARSRVAWEWKDLSGRDSGRGRMLQSGGNFFDQPLIIREEALFHGLNLFRGPGSDSSIRRRSLRPFIRGEIQDIDLGFCRAAADRRGGKVSIFRRSGGGEAGFSLLIKGPGRYNLEAAAWLGSNAGEKTVLRVLERGGDPSVRLEGEGFFALLPLVLRPFRPGGARASGGAAPRDAAFAGEQGFFGTRTESVPAPRFSAALIAQDAAGEAALIGVCHRSAVILWKREIQSGGDFFFCGIGGINAEQSER